jgi:hypothetical protein
VGVGYGERHPVYARLGLNVFTLLYVTVFIDHRQLIVNKTYERKCRPTAPFILLAVSAFRRLVERLASAPFLLSQLQSLLSGKLGSSQNLVRPKTWFSGQLVRNIPSSGMFFQTPEVSPDVV